MSTPNFLEIRFPTNVSLGAIGGQGWSTRVVVTDGGAEYRQQLWGYTRGKWQVGHNLRSPAQWAQLIAFHRLVMGKTFGFRFQDWSDYTDNNIGVLAQNAGSFWQLAKLYTQNDVFGNPQNNYRLISKPQPGTVTFDLNGTPYTFVGGGSGLDYTTGVVTFNSPDPSPSPSEVYTWYGQFDVPVRFDTDMPEISMDLPLTGAGWKGISVIELRIPGQ